MLQKNPFNKPMQLGYRVVVFVKWRHYTRFPQRKQKQFQRPIKNHVVHVLFILQLELTNDEENTELEYLTASTNTYIHQETVKILILAPVLYCGHCTLVLWYLTEYKK